MDSFENTVAFWASILGTFLGLLGAVQSITWLAWLGGLLAVVSIGAVVYAQQQRDRVESAVLKVAGRSIDSLNMASLRRRFNRSLVMQEVQNSAVIDGENLTINWKCMGYCRADRATSIEFSIDSDNNIPFDRLECFAYDVDHDPGERHRIRPILVGPDGISKKIVVPFLEPLESGEPFSVLLTCALPGCMKTGVEYYTATLSFEQEAALRYAVRLKFVRERPDWVRVYEIGIPGKVNLLKDLRPTSTSDGGAEYVDNERSHPPKSARIYVFLRSASSPLDEHHVECGAVGSR